MSVVENICQILTDVLFRSLKMSVCIRIRRLCATSKPGFNFSLKLSLCICNYFCHFLYTEPDSDSCQVGNHFENHFLGIRNQFFSFGSHQGKHQIDKILISLRVSEYCCHSLNQNQTWLHVHQYINIVFRNNGGAMRDLLDFLF